MKLLLCPSCLDVRKLDYHEVWCRCRRTSGKYLEDGAHAEVSPRAIVIGMDNHTVLRAINAQDNPDAGYRTLAAWVMSKDAPRVKWREKRDAQRVSTGSEANGGNHEDVGAAAGGPVARAVRRSRRVQ